MEVFQVVLFIFLIVCAISVTFSRNLLNSIIIFMSYSLMFFVTLKKIHAIVAIDEDKEDKHTHKNGMDKKGEAK